MIRIDKKYFFLVGLFPLLAKAQEATLKGRVFQRNMMISHFSVKDGIRLANIGISFGGGGGEKLLSKSQGRAYLR